MAYIDVGKLLKELTTSPDGTKIPNVDCDNFPTKIDLRLLKRIILRQPTADVEQVVYCKDCEWSVKRVTNNEIFPYQCLNTTACGKPRRALDFCSCGERRKDNEL